MNRGPFDDDDEDPLDALLEGAIDSILGEDPDEDDDEEDFDDEDGTDDGDWD